MPIASTVSIVVDPEFGSRLAHQVTIGPVWIIDTPTNRSAFEKYWREHPGESHLQGVTSFTGMPSASPEDSVINQLDMIDLHHGPFSSKVPYSVLEVIGSQLTHRIEADLREYGFSTFEPAPAGFRASRPVGEANLSG